MCREVWTIPRILATVHGSDTAPHTEPDYAPRVTARLRAAPHEELHASSLVDHCLFIGCLGSDLSDLVARLEVKPFESAAFFRDGEQLGDGDAECHELSLHLLYKLCERPQGVEAETFLYRIYSIIGLRICVDLTKQ